MKALKLMSLVIALATLGFVSGCSDSQSKSPDVTDSIRQSLDQAGLKDVKVSQDRDKGIVTLSGTTASDIEKAQAETVAKSIASTQVVANQIAVRPPGEENLAKKIDSDTDKGIEKNLHAELLKLKLDHSVNYDVKNGVVTLTGDVKSPSQRSGAEKAARNVPNVQQVVNELDVKNQKATSSK